MVIPLLVLKHMCCVCVNVVRQAAAVSYQATAQEDLEMNQNSHSGQNNNSQKEINFFRLNPVPLQ
jgi:hypothetical protein